MIDLNYYNERRVRTYADLDKIEDEAYDSACQGDLFFVRRALGCIDGIFLVISRDDTWSMFEGVYWLSYDDLRSWSEEEKKLFESHYGIRGH